MAKLITLNLGGVPVYPNTVTDAIADVASRKRLSDIIAELQSKPAGDSYSIVKDSESNLVYRLMRMVRKFPVRLILLLQRLM